MGIVNISVADLLGKNALFCFSLYKQPWLIPECLCPGMQQLRMRIPRRVEHGDSLKVNTWLTIGREDLTVNSTRNRPKVFKVSVPCVFLF